MAKRELKDKNRKTVALIADSTGQYVCEIQNIRHQTIGYVKQIQTRTKYEIQVRSHACVGFAEYFGNNLELKDRSRRIIAKLSSKLNITDDAVLLAIIDTYKGL